ncbi:MAG: helix-turn-helix domain-containing protein [Oscillospiraceae bacterium]|jgi:transcriptional regulator with XRE-family HTH domain|nr:helix-turn-helix domain-containing protein [Oscillospiraceae bacterium]
MDIGQTIKKLRRERDLTQEQLAELIGVTDKAISKWENGTGLPDISQIVPLASVFGVSTDVLFGTIGTNDDEEIAKIIDDANAMDADDGNDDNSRGYEYLLDALKMHPNNMKLLREALGWSVNRARLYHWTSDSCAAETYAEAEREAKLMINYGDLSDALYAHRYLISLYSVFGDFDKAEMHAAAFPDSAFGGFDMNRGAMTALVKSQAGDYAGSIKPRCDNIFSLLNVLEREINALGTAYMGTGQYADAITVNKAQFKLYDLVYDGGEYKPTLTRSIILHTAIAKNYLLLGDEDAAYEWLGKFADYHTAQAPHFNAREQPASPLVRERFFNFPDFPAQYDAKAVILQGLNAPWFKDIREQPRFKALLDRVNALSD